MSSHTWSLIHIWCFLSCLQVLNFNISLFDNKSLWRPSYQAWHHVSNPHFKSLATHNNFAWWDHTLACFEPYIYYLSHESISQYLYENKFLVTIFSKQVNSLIVLPFDTPNHPSWSRCTFNLELLLKTTLKQPKRIKKYLLWIVQITSCQVFVFIRWLKSNYYDDSRVKNKFLAYFKTYNNQTTLKMICRSVSTLSIKVS
jgi:hypothetical protein